MNIGIRGWQDTGKTALALGSMLELLRFHGYQPDEVIANLKINIPGVHCVTNAQLRFYLKMMVEKESRHKIIIIDEADRVVPARFWHDVEQTMSLLGLWQDEKLFNRVFWTAHQGTSVDLNLRNTTQIELEPYFYNPVKDEIPFTVYNALDGRVFDDCLFNVSKNIFPIYDRWAVIK
jgi:hypothetical protein